MINYQKIHGLFGGFPIMIKKDKKNKDKNKKKNKNKKYKINQNLIKLKPKFNKNNEMFI